MTLLRALAPFLRVSSFYAGRRDPDDTIVKTIVTNNGRAEHLTVGDFRRLREQVEMAVRDAAASLTGDAR